MSVTPSAPPDATGTGRGFLSAVAQAIGGVKTFAALIVASAGVQVASLFNTNGGGASDVGVKVGVSTADGSVNASAKPVSFRNGIGGTEVELAYLDSTGGMHVGKAAGFAKYWGAGVNFYIGIDDTNGLFGSYANSYKFILDSLGFTHITGGGNVARTTLTARIDQSGTDSSASPGAQTVAKPIGKNAIALGASSVLITNSLVTATSVIIITPHARDATCKELIAVPAAGSFTVSGSANATAALPFSWLVKGML